MHSAGPTATRTTAEDTNGSAAKCSHETPAAFALDNADSMKACVGSQALSQTTIQQNALTSSHKDSTQMILHEAEESAKPVTMPKLAEQNQQDSTI